MIRELADSRGLHSRPRSQHVIPIMQFTFSQCRHSNFAVPIFPWVNKMERPDVGLNSHGIPILWFPFCDSRLHTILQLGDFSGLHSRPRSQHVISQHVIIIFTWRHSHFVVPSFFWVNTRTRPGAGVTSHVAPILWFPFCDSHLHMVFHLVGVQRVQIPSRSQHVIPVVRVSFSHVAVPILRFPFAHGSAIRRSPEG